MQATRTHLTVSEEAPDAGMIPSSESSVGGTPPTAAHQRVIPLLGEDPVKKAATAYLWTPDAEASYRLAFKLLQEGYHLATSTYPLRAGGRDYPRGTLLARVERNPASLHDHITTLARDLGVKLSTTDTAYVDAGHVVGPGSEEVVSLKVPKVALIAGEETVQTSYGEIAYLLGNDMGIEFVPMSVETFRSTRMADFNVLILPNGRAKDYIDAFDKAGVEKLKAWCEDGGTLICVGGAAGFAADRKVNLSGSRVVGAEMLAKEDSELESDENESKAEKPSSEKEHQPEGKNATVSKESALKEKPNPDSTPTPTPKPTQGKDKDDRTDAKDDSKKMGFDRKSIPLAVPGATFRASLNLNHFLTYGYDTDTLPVLVDTDQFLTLTKRGANVVTFPAAPDGDEHPPSLRLAGFEWPDNTERLLRGTAAVIEEPIGDGHVVLTENGPSFRMLWRTSTRLWLNALLYAPALQDASERAAAAEEQE